MAQQKLIDTEKETVERVAELIAPPAIAGAGPDEIERRVGEVRELVEGLSSDVMYAEVFGMASQHPNSFLRHRFLELAADVHRESVFARRYLRERTHDDEDFVALDAIVTCGELELQPAFSDLQDIVESPVDGVEKVSQPIGAGFAKAVEAGMNVLGTDDLEAARRLEEYYDENRHFPLEELRKPQLERAVDDDAFDPDDPPEGMVAVPGGTYTFGVDSLSALPDDRIPEGGGFLTPYEMEVPPFYIDRYPVTNEEYAEFVEWVDEHGHDYCHPGEPDDKDHRPNVRHDDRFGPDHPVTGIDWFDAYAYAQWAGKDLPIEEEWEAAARGPEGNVLPWGDDWRPDQLNWAGYAFDREFEDLDEWRRTVAGAEHFEYDEPARTTTPVDEFPDNESWCGARDLVGNVWEYTKTSFVTRSELCPMITHPHRTSHENIYDNPNAHVVVRGGTWTSIPEFANGVYRTKDVMTDRHFEIGFRCVKRP